MLPRPAHRSNGFFGPRDKRVGDLGAQPFRALHATHFERERPQECDGVREFSLTKGLARTVSVSRKARSTRTGSDKAALSSMSDAMRLAASSPVAGSGGWAAAIPHDAKSTRKAASSVWSITLHNDRRRPTELAVRFPRRAPLRT